VSKETVPFWGGSRSATPFLRMDTGEKPPAGRCDPRVNHSAGRFIAKTFSGILTS